MRGRKPKPTQTKKAIGNPGRRPLNEREPQYPVLDGDVPAHLDEDARAVWAEYAPLLTTRGILTVADRLKFEMLCKAAGRVRQLDRHYRESAGPIITSIALQMDASGGGAQTATAKINPLLGAEVKYMLLVDKFGSSFGMDPAARARLKTPEPEKKNWLDALTGDRDDSGTGDPVH